MFELIVESFRQNYDAKISDSKHNRTGVPTNAVVRKYVAPEYITTGTMYATFRVLIRTPTVLENKLFYKF